MQSYAVKLQTKFDVIITHIKCIIMTSQHLETLAVINWRLWRHAETLAKEFLIFAHFSIETCNLATAYIFFMQLFLYVTWMNQRKIYEKNVWKNSNVIDLIDVTETLASHWRPQLGYWERIGNMHNDALLFIDQVEMHKNATLSISPYSYYGFYLALLQYVRLKCMKMQHYQSVLFLIMDLIIHCCDTWGWNA